MGIPKRSPMGHSNLRLSNGRQTTLLLNMEPSLAETKVRIPSYDDHMDALQLDDELRQFDSCYRVWQYTNEDKVAFLMLGMCEEALLW